MNNQAIVTSVVNQVWARNAEGELRVLEPGAPLTQGDTLVLAVGARVDIELASGQSLSFVGEQQVSDWGLDALGPLDRVAEAVETLPEVESSGRSFIEEGHGFVQLVRILEILEADGVTPLTLARVREYLRPLSVSLVGVDSQFDTDDGGSNFGADVYGSQTNAAPSANDDVVRFVDGEPNTGNLLDIRETVLICAISL